MFGKAADETEESPTLSLVIAKRYRRDLAQRTKSGGSQNRKTSVRIGKAKGRNEVEIKYVCEN